MKDEGISSRQNKNINSDCITKNGWMSVEDGQFDVDAPVIRLFYRYEN
jgi:hypothetical protein